MLPPGGGSNNQIVPGLITKSTFNMCLQKLILFKKKLISREF